MIHYRGPWPIIWTAWGAVRTAIVVYAIYVSHAEALVRFDAGGAYTMVLPMRAWLALAFWYCVVFLALELVGASRMKYDPPGIEIAKTWSQTQQFLASKSRWLRSVALFSSVLDVGAVAMIFWPLNPWLATALCAVFFVRYTAHIVDRSMWG